MAKNAFVKAVFGAGNSDKVHTKNARPSTQKKHEDGQARKQRDSTGRKAVLQGSGRYQGKTNNKKGS